MHTSTEERQELESPTQYQLNDLLAEWHRWGDGQPAVQGYGQCIMFTGVKSSGRQWDSENESLDSSLHEAQMKAFDHHVDELNDPMYRTALGIQARNLCTGHSVWTSARLPKDIAERAVIMKNARDALTKRLAIAGIL